MSDQIIKLLEYMGDKIGVAIDWTQENVMPYVEDLVKRFVTLNIVECILGVVLFLGFGGAAAIMWKIYCRGKETAIKNKEGNVLYDYYSTGPEIGGMFLIAAIITTILIAIAGVAINISELVKWIIVPELQIIEEVAYLIKPAV